MQKQHKIYNNVLQYNVVRGIFAKLEYTALWWSMIKNIKHTRKSQFIIAEDNTSSD